MPKVNIYLPDDLADDARTTKLSLSPICQRAIREELDRMHAKQAATSDLEAVAARLNDTIDEEEHEHERNGHENGVEWAREYATASELRHIAREFEPGRGGDFDSDHSLCAFESAKNAGYVLGIRHTDEGEDGAYWRGFIAGAGEVLEAVEPLLGA